MFIDVDQETGAPIGTPSTPSCIYKVADMEANGFKFLLTKRGILCTEVHFTGPFHLQFDDGRVLDAECIDSDYLGVKSTHRVVLSGGLPGDKVAFQAISTMERQYDESNHNTSRPRGPRP